MRFAAGLFVSAVMLASGDAVGIIGPWAFPVAVVVLLFASVIAAVAMEERELPSVEGLVVSRAQRPSPPASAG